MTPLGWTLVILGYLFTLWLCLDLWQSTGSTPVHPELTQEQKQRVKNAVKRHGNHTIERRGDTFVMVREGSRIRL
jgi:hypothetical protein